MSESIITTLISKWKTRAAGKQYSEEYRIALNDCIYELQSLIPEVPLDQLYQNIPSDEVISYLSSIEADSINSTIEAHE